MTAQKAIQEAAYVAEAIKRLSKNATTKLAPYVARPPRYITPLGGKYALLETPNIRSAGFRVWVLKYLVLARYLFSIVSPGYALRFLGRELRLYSQND